MIRIRVTHVLPEFPEQRGYRYKGEKMKKPRPHEVEEELYSNSIPANLAVATITQESRNVQLVAR